MTLFLNRASKTSKKILPDLKSNGVERKSMKVFLNGQQKEFAEDCNLKDIINIVHKDNQPVIAEVNGHIIKNPQWDQTPVKESDTIELVSFVGGGKPSPVGRRPLPSVARRSKLFVPQPANDEQGTTATGRRATKYTMSNDTPLIIAGKTFSTRFLLGTGKFKNKTDVAESIAASGTEIVTVALRRIDLERHEENILEYIPEGITLLTNTSGARNAKEAVRIARLARESGYGNWIKIEVINDSKYLLPDNYETIKATEILSAEGFVVLPYMSPDLCVARALVKAGAATVMPLGSLIGSNQGLKAKEFIKILIDEIDVPIIVDAGIGTPSQAAEAMEMGADALLANTAIATAQNPPLLAKAFAMAVTAGRLGFLSRLPDVKETANASSPLTGFLHET